MLGLDVIHPHAPEIAAVLSAAVMAVLSWAGS